MDTAKLRQRVADYLAQTGVILDGDNPWDPQVHNERFFARVLAKGSLGLGEAYMDGWWDCDALEEFFARILRSRLQEQVRVRFAWWTILKAKVLNRQSRKRAYEVGQWHYDLDNELYRRMLDERMIYSCGYWRDANGLDEAQRAKLDLICHKLGLAPGMRVLDVGCGWGGTLKYAAEHYGVEGVGITISKEQVRHARENANGLPLEFRLQDYRDVSESFDAIVSVGMFEHVGAKNYPDFFAMVSRCLKPEGLMLLHTIGQNRSSSHGDPWLDKYIFPNGALPSLKQIARAAEGRLVMEDWHNFGPDYARTLLAWHERFELAWPEVKERYDERFRRMWRYYLLSCAGAFRARDIHVWQVVFSPQGVPDGYRSIRI